MQQRYRIFNQFVVTLIVDLQLGVTLATFSIVSFYIIPESDLFDKLDLVLFIIYLVKKKRFLIYIKNK